MNIVVQCSHKKVKNSKIGKRMGKKQVSKNERDIEDMSKLGCCSAPLVSVELLKEYRIYVASCVGREGLEEMCEEYGFEYFADVDSVKDADAYTVCGTIGDKVCALTVLQDSYYNDGENRYVTTDAIAHEALHQLSVVKETRGLRWGKIGSDEHLAYLIGFIANMIARNALDNGLVLIP